MASDPVHIPNQGNHAVKTSYTSNPVPIPDTFLTGPAHGITLTPIPFATSPIPEYDGNLAIVLDNVISPTECNQLLQLAESSATADPNTSLSPWSPALVNDGTGLEALNLEHRHSDRIIWIQQTVVDRLWDRCTQADGVKELLSRPPDIDDAPGRWVFDRLNDYMRFLRYVPGQYFRPHFDGHWPSLAQQSEFRTHYTIHLYLNDADTSPVGDGLVGGSTAFVSLDDKRRVDVEAKAGRVLIFQHKGMRHEGAEVRRGVKYTMRTDILYRWVKD